MKKALHIAGAAAAVLALGIAPVMAQDGPFKDVPNDHWAYQALAKLAQDKIVIGDPDGLYHGKRTLTRYEMAVIIARLIDLLDQRYVKQPLPPLGGPPPDLSNYATKQDIDALRADLANKANKSDLAGLAKQSDVDMLRRMVAEFQTELTALGVDVDNIKKRLTAVEGRVTAIEAQLRRMPRISGSFNTYVRGNYRNGSGVTGFRDKDGFLVTKGPGTRGGLLADVRALHDLDVNVKANVSDNATVDATINFGNYLDFLNTITGFAGARSNRGLGAVQQDQTQTIYKAVLTTGVKLPLIGSTQVQVGRIPTQFTPYTFKNIDPDFYFMNGKTDMGNFPVDGARADFNLGSFRLTGIAAKTDPIRYVSNMNGTFLGDGGYGIMAGASTGGYFGGLNRANTVGLGANRGGMAVEQMGGVQARFNFHAVDIGVTGLAFGGSHPTGTPFLPFDEVDVYGANFDTRLGPFAVQGEYSKSDTRGPKGLIDNGRRRQITSKKNDAYDVNLGLNRGKISLKGGYRYVSPYFAAPGNWARVGTYQNPTDIKGGYGTGTLGINDKTSLVVNGQFYEGTGRAIGNGGLTTNQKINNYSAMVRLGMTAASTLELGGEYTEYNLGGGAKPREGFYSVGYGYMFNPATMFHLRYQIVDFDARNTGFDPAGNRQKGGVVTGAFSVKF